MTFCDMIKGRPMPFHDKLAAFALATALGCGAAHAQSCTPAHKIDSTVSPGKLTVAIYEYPPFAVTAGGKIGGVDGEIVQAIAASSCLTLVPLVVDPAATIQYVISGKADIAGGDWYRTAERAKVLGLSYPTYLDQMGIYSKDGVSTVASMIGKQVGTVSGFLWVAELQKLLGANLKLYPNPVALAQDLQAGRVQIGVDSYGTGAYAQKRGGYPGIIIKVAEPDQRVQASIQAAQANLPYTKTNASLGAAMDADIEAMHKDGKIAGYLKSFGLDPSGADTGEARLIK
jgi:polar amino acid transport system substrate-binding protein